MPGLKGSIPGLKLTIPSQPTECSIGPIEVLHELIESPCSPTECPLRPAQDMVRQRTFSGYYRAFLSLLQFTQACKGNSKANSDLLSLTRAPQSSAGLALADKMPSWDAFLDQKKALSG